jgi:hypothetical protein
MSVVLRFRRTWPAKVTVGEPIQDTPAPISAFVSDERTIRMTAQRPEGTILPRRRSLMQSSGPDAAARQLAEEARPVLGAQGFSDERIDELASAFVNDHVGEGTAQFVNWALAEGPFGLDPEEGF